MTIYHLHLHPEPFSLIDAGTKTAESRLLDEKRQKYSIGDRLVFANRADESQTIEVDIIGLHKAQSFHDLFSLESLNGKFGAESIDDLEANIKKYYSDKDEKRYGVVGIEFTKSH